MKTTGWDNARLKENAIIYARCRSEQRKYLTKCNLRF